MKLVRALQGLVDLFRKYNCRLALSDFEKVRRSATFCSLGRLLHGGCFLLLFCSSLGSLSVLNNRLLLLLPHFRAGTCKWVVQHGRIVRLPASLDPALLQDSCVFPHSAD